MAPAFQAVRGRHLEPHRRKRERDVKVRGKMVAVRKQPDCLPWVGDAVKAKLALRSLGHLRETEEKRQAAKSQQQPAQHQPLPEPELHDRAENGKRNDKGYSRGPGRLRRA